MKASPGNRRPEAREMPGPDRERGSIVLVALCLVTVLGVAVVGLLAVCARTMELSNRAFCYTSSTQLAEIGMEEALWSLDQQLNTSGYAWSGWTLATVNGVATATKTLTGFATNTGLQGTVNITVQYYNTSTPYTQPPVITSDGVSQMPDGIQIDKQLKAIVKPATLFTRAVGAAAAANVAPLSEWPYPTGDVAFVQNTSGTVDSYDSSLGNYTPAGTTNRSDQAIVSGPFLQFTHTNLYGYAATANSSATAPSTSTTNITTLGGSGVNSSRICNSGNQRTFDIVSPSAAGSILPYTGSIGPGFYYYTSGNYIQNSGTLTITGPATIYIPNSMEILGAWVISSSSTGPVQVYVGGELIIDSSGGVDNQTKNPAYLGFFGPASSVGYLYTTTAYYGVIDMPNSVFYVYGLGANLDVYGSIVGLNVLPYYSNNLKIHYDLNLRKTTFSMVNTPFEVTTWVEN